MNKLVEALTETTEQPVKRYCRLCGMPKTMVFTGYFDEETGEKLTEFVCENLRCVSGCGRAGHQFQLLGFACCSRCGAASRRD